MTDKQLISKIYKWLTQLNIKQKLKMGRRPEQTFSPKKTYRSPQYKKNAQHLYHQKNANQNHNELSPQICENG